MNDYYEASATHMRPKKAAQKETLDHVRIYGTEDGKVAILHHDGDAVESSRHEFSGIEQALSHLRDVLTEHFNAEQEEAPDANTNYGAEED